MTVDAVGSMGPGLLREILRLPLTLTGFICARLGMLWSLFHLAIDLLWKARMKTCNVLSHVVLSGARGMYRTFTHSSFARYELFIAKHKERLL